MSFWTYMLHCADRTFYVGQTDDLEKRLGQHERGIFAGYTSTRLPVALVWSQEFATRGEAREAENRLKGWGRPKKLALIRGDCAAISAPARGKKKASTSSAKSVGVGLLQPHVAHLPSEPFNLEAIVRRRTERFNVRYRLTGPIDILAMSSPGQPIRRDELWRHTCFEAFAMSDQGDAYFEFNFSPSTDWAAYRFDAYRSGMSDLEIEPPLISVARTEYAIDLEAIIDLPKAFNPTCLSLSAVIEEKSGHKSYWALQHPAGPPDFHHPDCFALELPPSPTP